MTVIGGEVVEAGVGSNCNWRRVVEGEVGSNCNGGSQKGKVTASKREGESLPEANIVPWNVAISL